MGRARRIGWVVVALPVIAVLTIVIGLGITRLAAAPPVPASQRSMPVEFVGRASPDWAVDRFAELENTRTDGRLATSIVITVTRFAGQGAPPRFAATFQTDQGPYVCDAPRRAAWGAGDSVDIRLLCSFFVPSDRLNTARNLQVSSGE